MTRRLLATVKNHEAQRCAKVYRDKTLQQYAVVFLERHQEVLQELRTGSREEAYIAAWGFAWPHNPVAGNVP